MDQILVPQTHIEAGREYLAKLRQLGLNPEGVFWGLWDGAAEPNLLIVTSLFDRFGPLKISELLFQAYRASALPQEIDPFNVELHSPNQDIIRGLMTTIKSEKDSLTPYGIDGPMQKKTYSDGKIMDMNYIFMRVGPLLIPMSGLYVLDAPTMSRNDQLRTWNRFRRHVEALAA